MDSGVAVLIVVLVIIVAWFGLALAVIGAVSGGRASPAWFLLGWLGIICAIFVGYYSRKDEERAYQRRRDRRDQRRQWLADHPEASPPMGSPHFRTATERDEWLRDINAKPLPVPRSRRARSSRFRRRR
jgi:hypothetical protein